MKIFNLFSNKALLITFFLGSALLFIPNTTFSSSIAVSSVSSVSALDTTILEVYLDTEGETLNTVEGSLMLSDEHGGDFEIREISVANSVFTMWPRKPSLEDNNTLDFIGGVPDGVVGDRLLLFKIIVKINQPGIFKASLVDGISYLNDGQGTPTPISPRISEIVIGSAREEAQNKWEEIISNDNNAPLPFEISIIQDIHLYEGKKFISFETFDEQSGISHYEVREGVNPAVRTGTSYVLIDQKNKVDIVVTAYDKAGNFQVSTLKGGSPINWSAIILIVLIIIIVKVTITRLRNRKNK
jgi:hypothetical protein